MSPKGTIMARNLHISYDLNVPGQNYDAVIAKIKSLGSWAKIHKSFWYVNSNYTAQQACEAVWAVMDASDTIYVVDASNNDAAWQNLIPAASQQIKDQWYK
jgi:hypothetical protein